MNGFKPLLAETCHDIRTLRFPVLASPKLDGIRCVKLNGKALTRKLKPVPNEYVRRWVEANLPDGIDGELMLADHRAPFSDVSSAIMGRSGEPDFVFMAFDWLPTQGRLYHELQKWPSVEEEPFSNRFDRLKEWVGPGAHHLKLVPHVQAESPTELQEIVDAHVDAGYEGTMVRSLHGRYKFGRSGLKEAILLKIKAFEDTEAVVVGVVEQMHNGNEATKDNLGRTKRSTAKAGKTGKDTLGALKCVAEVGEHSVEFEIGTGFTDAQRAEIWKERDGQPGAMGIIGRIVKFKHQPPPGGMKPGESFRFPVFLGWRED